MGFGAPLPNGCGVMSRQLSNSGATGTPQGQIKVLLVDDSKLARAAMAAELACYPQIRISGQAENGAEGLTMAVALRPHLVLTDLDMPVLDGFQLAQRLREVSSEVRVIVTSAHNSRTLRAASLRAGADEFIPKERLPELLPAFLARFFPQFNNPSKKKEYYDLEIR